MANLTDKQLSKKESQKNFIENLRDKILEQIEKDTLTWTKHYRIGELSLPINGSTGKPYRGTNIISLITSKYEDPRWFTFNQAQENNLRIKKGSKSEKIIYYTLVDKETKKDIAELPQEEQGKKETFPVIKYFSVFNAVQCDGVTEYIPPIDNRTEKERNGKVIIILENLKKTGLEMEEGIKGTPNYNPVFDRIQMPYKENFESQSDYYATLLHEMVHATNAPHRLDRKFDRTDIKEKAREEVTAELASYILAGKLGVAKIDHDNHIAYLASWGKNIKDDPNILQETINDAVKAADYLEGFSMENIVEHAQNIDIKNNIGARSVKL